MKRIVWKYGLWSGAIISTLTAVMLTLGMSGTIEMSGSELVGYSAMALSFLLVFFGIRRYRDEVGGGAIGFGKALGVGLLIVLVTCGVYVVTWEIVYWGFYPDFLDDYHAFRLQTLRDSGASAEAIAQAEQQMARFAELYANPLFNAAITFLEIFPVGLIVALVSAAILRRRTPPEEEAAALAT